MIDYDGQVVIPFEYDPLPLFVFNGKIHARKHNRIGVLDRSGRELTPFIYDGVDSPKGSRGIHVWIGDKHGYLDDDGRTIVPVEHDSVRYLRESDYIVTHDKATTSSFERSRLFGLDGTELLKGQYARIGCCSEGFFTFCERELWGIAELLTERVVVAPRYEKIHPFSEGFAAVIHNNR